MKLKEQIDAVIEVLERQYQKAETPYYDENTPYEQLQEKLAGKVIEIDAMLVVYIRDVLQQIANIAQNYETNEEAVRDYLKIDLEIRDEIKAEPNKAKAYQRAAKKKGWTHGKRTPDYNLLSEYLILTGVLCFRDGSRPTNIEEILNAILWYDNKYLKKIQPMDKKEAIQILTEKHQIQSYDATYQRLKKAKKKWINNLKKENKDFSHLINVLPANYPPT